jgi:UDP-glucose 4-epimerase
VQHAHSSHEKAERVFGSRPQTTLADGLARMAAWVRAHGARSSAAFKGIEITKQLPPAWQVR